MIIRRQRQILEKYRKTLEDARAFKKMIEKHKQSPQKSVIKYKKNIWYGFDKQASQASLFKELEQSVLLTPNPVLNALNLNFSSKDDGNDYLNTTN